MNYTWLEDNLLQILGLVIIAMAVLIALAAKQKKVGNAATMVVIIIFAVLTVGLADVVGNGWADSIIGNILT